MKLISYGKINMFLNIVGKRENGYHYIETLIQRIDLFDEIELNVDKSLNGREINIFCSNSTVPTNEENIAYKAALWFMDKYRLNGKVQINIYKNIPICAGLGGGTSNGAEVIKALNTIYDVNVPIDVLAKESVVLGTDFPYSIMGGTMLCEGVGERLTSIKSLDNNIVLIVKPDFGFATREVYNNFDIKNVEHNIDKNKFIGFINKGNLYEVCKSISNTLEYSNVMLMDVIRDIKIRFIKNGALGSCMSGSGSCVYGVFDNLYKAQKCYDDFKKDFNNLFLTRTIDR